MTVPQQRTKQAPPAELVEITVDGRTIRAPLGQNLLQTLLDNGDDVSYFCYHPGLSIAGKCRQCLVRLKGISKFLTACQLKVEPGLEIESNTERVREIRRGALEATLLNHPIDCVICDKAGECALQRQYMDWDARPTSLNHEKVHKPKKVDLGPHIMLDAERCILCDRCVRFCAEVPGQPQLVFAGRGDHTVVTTAPGERLDNPYSLNTVDICPVGALTDKDFRFQSRVWELSATQSVCNGCAAGCELEIHHKQGRIYRLVPRKRWDLNLNWMCDFGRRTYKTVHEDRLDRASCDGQPCAIEAAVERAAQGLRDLTRRGAALGLVIGADVANEDAYAARLLAESSAEVRLYLAERPDDGQGDDILRRDDPNPNRAGTRACVPSAASYTELTDDLEQARLTALVVIGDALELPAACLDGLGQLELVVVQATRTSELTRRAHVVLPAACWAEVDGTVTSYRGETKRMRQAIEPPRLARAHWSLLARIAEAMGRPLPATSAKELFTEMTQQVGSFADATWGADMPTTLLRWAGRRG